jgi:hypothetical protein
VKAFFKVYGLIIPVLAVISISCGDIVKLKTGAEIKGKIQSFSDVTGLVISTDYGETTIKPGNFSSFIVTSGGDSGKSLVTTYAQSRLRKSGIKLDMKVFADYETGFDEDLQGFGKPWFKAMQPAIGVAFLVSGEETGMANKEYSDLALNFIKTSAVGFKASKDSSFTLNGIPMIMKEVLIESNGVSLKYYLTTFVVGEFNVKLVCSGLETLYNKKRQSLLDLMKAVSLEK